MEELKPCPFCGRTDTVDLTDCRELEECENFECCEIDGYVCVVCDVNKGGCGASGGYAKTAKEATEKWNRRAAPENKICTDCSGIMYRQTGSGKIIPVNQRCGVKITPPCYQPDGDGCAYQIYGDNNDEPIDRCKACPLCYSDKVRHTAPENKPLTLEQLRQMNGEPVWIAIMDGSEPTRCEIVVEWFEDGIKMANTEDLDDYGAFDLYGKTWLAYAHRPEGAQKWSDLHA